MIFKLVYRLDAVSVTLILFMERQGALVMYLLDLISPFYKQNKV